MMRKTIAAINMTLDGICDHHVGIVDQALHQHYSELLNNAGLILYGRKTFQLMQFWQTLLTNPSDEKTMNDFANSINKIEKIVFSNTLKNTGWDTAKIADKPPENIILDLKKQSGQDILIGSRSLIIQLLNSNLIDEFQICIHPMVEGKGLRLFDQIKDRISFKLNRTKSFDSGVIILYYEPTKVKLANR
ncbi:dihydrofolate reductase family protein [Chryseobacterium koreense]